MRTSKNEILALGLNRRDTSGNNGIETVKLRIKSNLFFAIFMLFVFCFACEQKQSSTEDLNLTYIYLDSLSEKDNIIENPDKCRFVKLETTRDCLIGEIKKLQIEDDKIFIADKNKKIFVFDIQGNFLNTVGNIGQGPDDHLAISEFYLDSKNQRICVYDIFRASIFSYDYSGKLLEKTNINRDVFSDISRIYMADDNKLILRKDNSVRSPFNYTLVSGENYEQSENRIPYIVVGEKGLVFDNITTITGKGNNLLLSAYGSDTIYKYESDKGMIPYIVFKNKYKPISAEDVKGLTFETAGDALRAKGENRSKGVESIQLTNKYLFFDFNTDNGIREVFWDLEAKKGFLFNYFVPNVYNQCFSRLVTSTEDAFVCYIEAENFMQADWSENESAKKFAENTLDDDNPILAFYYLE